ncbi:SepM family pheromone-processing serine protease [Vagococcus vulneris]|uniref:endopeptidase La n=1 Tax=Vagococcus vulneris TaxID=1977869 RepID=A0A430A1A0_9ENTE|nr:SepM family pheromone-processing serine protease [Vagococcus vulneris]RSU00144.1 hypothetical protein CBF37_02260 [Vagococcus vulneris]
MKKFKQKKFLQYFLLGVILLVAACTVIPVPYYLEMPGTAESLKDYMSVNGKRDKLNGEFLMTTVGIRQATVANYLMQPFVKNTDLVPKKDLIGDNSYKEYEEIQMIDMKNSQIQAMEVALTKADKTYTITNEGVYVLNVIKESPFTRKLKTGDIIIAIDGQKGETSKDLINLLKDKKVGSEVTVTFKNFSGKTADTKGKLIKLPNTKRSGIGVTLIDKIDIKTADKISFNLEEVGGPSAGLMFSLELYAMLSQKELTKGHIIAGTGTISSDGAVGPIGGIDKKVVAAEKAGAEFFFAPDDELTKEEKKEQPNWKSNYQEAVESAKRNKLTLQVIPVKTFDDAVKFLNNLP